MWAMCYGIRPSVSKGKHYVVLRYVKYYYQKDGPV
jgi:hypothetical protein